MPNNGEYFILANKKLVSKLNLHIGDRVVLKLEKDFSEFGHPIPETFAALLDQDEVGRNHFYQLTPGKQRSLIYLIGTVKNVDSQLNKGMAILDHLKMENGQLDFKKLNALIKHYNQRWKRGA